MVTACRMFRGAQLSFGRKIQWYLALKIMSESILHSKKVSVFPPVVRLSNIARLGCRSAEAAAAAADAREDWNSIWLQREGRATSPVQSFLPSFFYPVLPLPLSLSLVVPTLELCCSLPARREIEQVAPPSPCSSLARHVGPLVS